MIASSLFHFTRDFDTIIKIISESKFRASYNIEDVSDFYPEKNYVGIPMVCFCDIPLKFISEHPMVYGKYGIGLKKAWGIAKGVNPILYRTTTQIKKYLEGMIKAAQNIPENSREVMFNRTVIIDNILRLSNYSKKYKTDKIINYFDREWRFVPSVIEASFLENNSITERDGINNDYFQRNPDYLPFNLADIKYIIVPNKKEVENMIESIRMMERSDKSKSQLCQLIIDLTCIQKDF